MQVGVEERKQYQMKINHIGYLVKNFEEAKAEFEKLGYKPVSKDTHDTIRLVDICFMEQDNYVIELVSPYDQESVVAGLIKKYKNTPYHICYETEDFDNDIDKLEHSGYVKMDEPLPAPAFENRRVVFLFHSQIGMIELVDVFGGHYLTKSSC